MPAVSQVLVKEYNYADTLWCTYIVSVVAASIAELATYPLDLTKTRLQIQGELANKQDAKISSQKTRENNIPKKNKAAKKQKK